MGYIRNTVLIQAPVDDVFRLTNNVRTWPDLFTEYAQSEVLEESDDSVTFRLTMHPDEHGKQWSWIAIRRTDRERRSTCSERDTSSGPFARMVIRWWYDAIDEETSVMTWEQEFAMKPQAPMSDEGATEYLNRQTRIQQQVIKKRVEQIYHAGNGKQPLYRHVIVKRYQEGREEDIVAAFTRSDATELPHLLGVNSRHIWVYKGIYLHFIEGQMPMAAILKEYGQHPLFLEVKNEADQYVSSVTGEPEPYPVAREIYCWRNE